MLRLSEHFLLLDFLYGQSTIDCVVQCGDLLADRVASINEDWEEIAEGRYLCETVLEHVVERHGCVSIGAGLWFKNLPGQGGAHADGPHKWNRSSGAAADIVVHSWIDKDKDPKKFPHSLPSSDIEYHRAWTYVGSEFCCLASRSAGNKYKAGYADWGSAWAASWWNPKIRLATQALFTQPRHLAQEGSGIRPQVAMCRSVVDRTV